LLIEFGSDGFKIINTTLNLINDLVFLMGPFKAGRKQNKMRPRCIFLLFLAKKNKRETLILRCNLLGHSTNSYIPAGALLIAWVCHFKD